MLGMILRGLVGKSGWTSYPPSVPKYRGGKTIASPCDVTHVYGGYTLAFSDRTRFLVSDRHVRSSI